MVFCASDQRVPGESCTFHRNRAFTLIELLVVLAIVGILASLLLPSLHGAKVKARDLSCIHNLKQLGIGFLAYTIDYGSLPAFTESNWPLIQGDWHHYLVPTFSESPSIRLCPATMIPKEPFGVLSLSREGSADKAYGRKIYPGISTISQEPSNFRSLYSSYGLNHWLRSVLPAPKEMQARHFGSESSLVVPAETPVFADSLTPSSGPIASSPPTADLYMGSPESFGAMAISPFQVGRHGGSRGPLRSSTPVSDRFTLRSWRLHSVYFDGHFSRPRLDDTWNLYWHKDWEVPVTRP